MVQRFFGAGQRGAFRAGVVVGVLGTIAFLLAAHALS